MNTTLTTYAIRVDGHLDDHWASWLGDLNITRNGDGTSTLIGPIADQAQLHGVLAGLRDIGAVLIDLHTTEPSAPIDGSDPPIEPSSRNQQAASRPVLEHPLVTERLTLCAATVDDADPTGSSANSTQSTNGSPDVPPTSTATATCSPSPPASRQPSSFPSATTPQHRSSETSCSAATTPGPNSR